MTLFEKTIPDMSYDIQYPEAHAKEYFTYTNRDAEYIISAISEDSGETICSRSLIMYLQQMTERIYELECEISKLNGEN
jgi:myosin-crossreactive antigen